ncbi:hypothetical protein GJ496_011778 [Pomphorhynchus laevis]|nr:hypothetical protein GJ496_011778 [Pomphorhynchus laevis]
MQYADDILIYAHAPAHRIHDIGISASNCLSSIYKSLSNLHLVLNPEKSKIMWILPRKPNISPPIVSFASSIIPIVHNLTFLGFHFDDHLSLKPFVRDKVRSSNLILRDIRRIRPLIDFRSCMSLLSSLFFLKSITALAFSPILQNSSSYPYNE